MRAPAPPTGAALIACYGRAHPVRRSPFLAPGAHSKKQETEIPVSLSFSLLFPHKFPVLGLGN
jgi:hypothetical protein